MKTCALRYGLLLLSLFIALVLVERNRRQDSEVTIGGPGQTGENIYRAFRDRVERTERRQRDTAAAE